MNIKKNEKSEEEWKRSLTPEEYHVLREKGTDPAFTGKYWDTTDQGTYVCRGCGHELFLSDTKYDAGCGWPSFYEPLNNETIESVPDHSFGMTRTEVKCRHCGAHLGHVFDDGPREHGGARYCINSTSLTLKKKK